MKKLRLFAVAAFAAMFTTTYAQTVVDVGYDWDPSGLALINSATGTVFAVGQNAYVVNTGTDNQVDFNLVNTSGTSTILSDNKSVYKSTTSKSIAHVPLKADNTDYFQVDVKDVKKITKIEINGTSSSTTLTGDGAIVYSSSTPFSENAIIGYETLTLAICRAGDAGKTFDTTIPAGTKSFRLYKAISLTPSGNLYVIDAAGTKVGKDQIRVAYVSVTINDDGAVATPTIGLSSGSNAQTVYPTQSIKNIVYKWGGTATSASVTWSPSIPDGITVATDPASKSLTISGAPTGNAAATYSYSVVATDGTQNTTPLTGSIAVKVTNKYKLAYVTALTSGVPTNSAESAITTPLSEKFDINYISADATGINYGIYDIIVLSAYPTSTAAGVLELKTSAITKPFVNMKAFALQASSNRWAWLDEVKNTTSTSIVVPANQKSHPIFTEVTWTGVNSDEVSLTTATSGNCVIGYTAWTTPSVEPTVLASVTDASSVVYPSFAEVKTGTTLGGMTHASTAPQILYNLSEASWPSITADAVKIAVNAARYVVGDLGSSGVGNSKGNAGKEVVAKEYYDILGKKLSSRPINSLGIEKKVYQDGSVSFDKVFYRK